jgi:hypothetical protein
MADADYPRTHKQVGSELQLAIGAARAAVRGGCVRRVGSSGWSGRRPTSRRCSALDCVSVQLELARRRRPGHQSVPACGLLVSRSRSMIRWRGKPPGAGRRLASNQPMPAPVDEPSRLEGSGSRCTLAIGVESVDSWPCGQDSQSKPGCHRRRDLRHEARGVGYWFDCGAGAVLLWASSHRPGGRVPICLTARGF